MSQSSFDPGDVYPSLTYEDAGAAIAFLENAFGFVPRLVVPGANGRVEHSELSLGRAVIMVSSPKEEMKRVGPKKLSGHASGLCLRVDHVDAHYKRAVAAGAEIIRELQHEDYGSYGYMAADSEGHIWYFGTYRPGAHWVTEA
jgi:uncharacterized glyoxalase superfamily protein PhnB